MQTPEDKSESLTEEPRRTGRPRNPNRRKDFYRYVGVGIYEDEYSLRATVRLPNGRTAVKRFRLGTPVENIQAWREGTRAAVKFIDSTTAGEQAAALKQRKKDSSTARLLLKGWCYLYIVSNGKAAKIGRAVNVAERLKELQTSSPEPLTLMAAAPIHASIEPYIHKRFAHLRMQGEWFRLTPQLFNFAEALWFGMNPAYFVLEELKHHDACFRFLPVERLNSIMKPRSTSDTAPTA